MPQCGHRVTSVGCEWYSAYTMRWSEANDADAVTVSSDHWPSDSTQGRGSSGCDEPGKMKSQLRGNCCTGVTTRKPLTTDFPTYPHRSCCYYGIVPWAKSPSALRPLLSCFCCAGTKLTWNLYTNFLSLWLSVLVWKMRIVRVQLPKGHGADPVRSCA